MLKAFFTEWADPKKAFGGEYFWGCPQIKVIDLGRVTTGVLEELCDIVKPRWELFEAITDSDAQRWIVKVRSIDYETCKPRKSLKWRPVSERPIPQAEESS